MNDTLLEQQTMSPSTPEKQDQVPEQTPPPVMNIPKKFIDSATGEVRVESLLKSYLELEKKLSTRPSGAPQSVEDYCIDCEHGLFEPDAEINHRLHNKGFSKEQAQEVYDIAAEKMVPMIMDIAAEYQAERELDRLKDHFGGEEKWREVSSQLLSFGQKNLPPEVLKGMASSYEGVMALYKMMNGGAKDKTPSPRAEAKPAVSENELYSMMRQPGYWRDKDPSMIEKVTKGFHNLYGSK